MEALFIGLIVVALVNLMAVVIGTVHHKRPTPSPVTMLYQSANATLYILHNLSDMRVMVYEN